MANIYLITGASSDVGLLLLQCLLQAAAGDDVFVAQGYGDMQGLAPLVQAYPGRIHSYDVDLSRPAAVKVFISDVENNIGCPSHLVHLPALPVENIKFKQFNTPRFEKDMQVQLGSATVICQRFLPQMAKQKYGRVLFMLSSYILGLPPKNTSAYIVAKQALYGLAKSLAADYAAHGITVNCVAPSMMQTKFLAQTPQLIVQAAAAANPTGRNATPQDVVPAMQFLLSDDAAFITGVVLPITGGSA